MIPVCELTSISRSKDLFIGSISRIVLFLNLQLNNLYYTKTTQFSKIITTFLLKLIIVQIKHV